MPKKKQTFLEKIWCILQRRTNGYQINSLTFEIRHSEYRVKFPFFLVDIKDEKMNGNLNIAESILGAL